MDRYLRQSSDLTNSLLLVIPLLVLYEAGLLLTGFQTLNGVDFLTIFLVRYFGVKGLLIFNLGLLALLIVVSHVRARNEEFDTGLYVSVTAESLLYASSMGAIIVFLMRQLAVPLAVGEGMAPLQLVIISLGAGLNEELLFRLVLFGGLWFVAEEMFELPRASAGVGAAIISSVLFSLAHYAPGGELFEWASFTYRFLAGLLFCLLYHLRGFAVAVYTHALYDVLVLLPRSLGW